MAGMLLMGMYWYVYWHDDFMFANQSSSRRHGWSGTVLLKRLDLALKQEMLTLIRA